METEARPHCSSLVASNADRCYDFQLYYFIVIILCMNLAEREQPWLYSVTVEYSMVDDCSRTYGDLFMNNIRMVIVTQRFRSFHIATYQSLITIAKFHLQDC